MLFWPGEYRGYSHDWMLELNLIGRELKRRGQVGLCRVPEPCCRTEGVGWVERSETHRGM
jgi:hypothetical protein